MYAVLENQAASYRRKYEYFEKCICAREYAKETRLWRAEDFFKERYRENLGKCTRQQWTTKRSELLEIVLQFLLLSGYAGTIVMLLYYLFEGEISVGAFAAVFSSFGQLFDRMENVFNYQVGSITRQFGAAQNYYGFLNLKERNGRLGGILMRERIELKGVCFAYPNSTSNALCDINMTVEKGDTMAIVGVNGSGKSTLTRVLMGLLVPTEGQMLIDSKDIKSFSLRTLSQGVSAVFQRYQCYKMTVEKTSDYQI